MNVELNIGLGNSPLDWSEISRELSFRVKDIRVRHTQKVVGVYASKREMTLYVDMDTIMTEEQLISFIKDMCIALNQECIAVRSIGFQHLVYNPFFTGHKFPFNNNFFVVR